MAENLTGHTLEELLTQTLTAADGECYLTEPTQQVLEALGKIDPDSDILSDVQIIATESVLKSARNNFHLGARLADHVEQGTLTLRVTDDALPGLTVTTNDTVYALVVAPNGSGQALAADDEQFITDAVAHAEEQFDAATEFDLRTPGLERTRNTMTETLGEATTATFDRLLNKVDVVGSDTVDEVELALCAAAINENQLYEVSRWGETIGLASKASFSRKKTNLEDAGVFTTEKIPVDVGRPRQRLLIASTDAADDIPRLPSLEPETPTA